MTGSEKLMALKKAYADIILNTVKEAAARIMVSERKAMRYQQELFAAKEDGLRILIRLKQMLDAKVNETQVVSLCQQRKIEELEAQLGEAEDIVKDLRAELREVQDELERATINQNQLLDEQNSNGDATTLMTTSTGSRFDTSETVMSSLPDAPFELFIDSDTMRNSTLNSTYKSKKCYVENGSHKDNCYFCNSDFASIVMRRKEPKLYRNGCTQRIHAFERNLLEENLSLPGKVENVKHETCTAEDKEDLCKSLDPEADEMCTVEDSPNEIKLSPADSNCFSVRPFKSFSRKRKRAARCRKSRTVSSRNFPDQVVETTQNSDIFPRTFLDVVNNNVEYEESKIFEDKVEKEPESMSALSSPSDTSEMILQSGYGEVTGSDTVENTANNDGLLTDTLELTRQESSPAGRIEIPACKTVIEAVNMSLVNSDVKLSNLTERITTKSLNDKFLKYTFQRKRKKEPLGSHNGYSSFEEGVMKRKMVENLNGPLESANSNLITELSRDRRSLVQVACEVISLSEKQ